MRLRSQISPSSSLILKFEKAFIFGQDELVVGIAGERETQEKVLATFHGLNEVLVLASCCVGKHTRLLGLYGQYGAVVRVAELKSTTEELFDVRVELNLRRDQRRLRSDLSGWKCFKINRILN